MTSKDRRWFGSGAVVLLGFLVGLVMTPTIAAAYNPSWNRLEAGQYAAGGIYERYRLGGKKWIPNNVWDPAGTGPTQEGVDCSGYVSKSWALADWSDPQTNYPTSGHGTWHYYWETNRNWVHRDIMQPYVMAGFVYRSLDDSSGHMGLFRSQKSGTVWTTWEARGTSYGVVVYSRDLITIQNTGLGGKGVDRKDWGYTPCLGCIPTFPET